MTALFAPTADGLVQPGEATRGPWDPRAQHGGAPAALVARAVERLDEADGFRVARITLELLSPVPLTPLRVDATPLRTGRQARLVDVELRAEARLVVRARALLLRRGAGPATADEGPTLPSPDDAEAAPVMDGGRATFADDAMEIRFARGSWRAPGPAVAWFRLRRAVFAGERPTPLQRVLAAADFPNGVSAELDWDVHAFVNPDLTVVLDRDAVGEWIGLDARTRVASDGTGTAYAALHDERGRIGLAAQTLLVTPR